MLLDMLIVALGAVYLVTGVVSRRVQPRNRIGVIMMLAGASWLVDHTTDDTNLALLLPAKLWPALMGHLIVAFPTGRLRTPVRRIVVGAAYAECAALAAARSSGGPAWVIDAEPLMTMVIGLCMVALLIRQWTCSSVAQRRTLTAMAGASVVAVVVFAAWEPAYRAGLQPPYLALMAALAGIPLAYLAGLLRRRFDRGAVADLVVRLSEGHRSSVRDALATTLHDPSLHVGYWLASQQRYVDADGAPMTPPPGSVLTQVNRGDNRVALLAHDPVLLDNAELVDAACAAVALALDNERLTAELRARVRQLAESRSRVLEAAETERRRIERDLHDGVQQRLLSVAMTLGLAEATTPTRLTSEAKDAVLATIDELRALCHGIHPPVLTERGLHGAVRELTAVASGVDVALELPERLPPQVETTAYYVVAEALANVTKHAAATRTRVEITGARGMLVVRVNDDGRGGADVGGSGLRGLSDRVEANGGTLLVTSTPGQGTSVEAVLPCGS